MSVKRQERCVILIGIGGTLAEVDRKNCESFAGIVFLILATGEAQNLHQLPAVFGSVTIIGKDRVPEIEFFNICRRVTRTPAQWRDAPSFLKVGFFQRK